MGLTLAASAASAVAASATTTGAGAAKTTAAEAAGTTGEPAAAEERIRATLLRGLRRRDAGDHDSAFLNRTVKNGGHGTVADADAHNSAFELAVLQQPQRPEHGTSRRFNRLCRARSTLCRGSSCLGSLPVSTPAPLRAACLTVLAAAPACKKLLTLFRRHVLHAFTHGGLAFFRRHVGEPAATAPAACGCVRCDRCVRYDRCPRCDACDACTGHGARCTG